MTVKISGIATETADLYLYDTVNNVWKSASETCTGENRLLTLVDGELTVNICHLTQFAVFQKSKDFYFSS